VDAEAKVKAQVKARESVCEGRKRKLRILAQICLLHYAEKFVLVNLAVAVSVRLINHLLQLVVCQILAELLGNAFEVLVAETPV
jgi:hypothetical protein